MSASGFTPIQLYRTTTAAAIPTAGNLAAGELGINLTDERLYFKNAAGVVKLLASNSGALGTVTSVDVSGGTTGLTTSGGPITSSGTITLAGTLGVANGGTGATTFTANGVVYGNTTSALLVTAAGTTGQVLVGNTGGAPSWATLSGIGVTSFSGGTTGLTPNTATTGVVTLAGTLAVANGGTGVTTSTGTTNVVLSNSPTLVTPTLGAASATSIANALGAVGTPSYTFTGDLNTGMWSPGVDTVAFSTNGGERMRIDSSGNVGIGITTPVSYAGYGNLTVNGASGGTLTLRNSANTNSSEMAATASEAYLKSVVATPLWFGTNNTERMRIDSSGNVGIGVTPSAWGSTYKGLDVRTAAVYDTPAGTASGFTFNAYFNGTNWIYKGTGGNATALRYEQGFGMHQWYTAPSGAGGATITFTERMRITEAGDVGIGISSPGAKLEVTGSVRIYQSTGGVFNMQYTTANAASRSWQINHDVQAYGDFAIQQSTTQTGSTYADRLLIDASGNVGIGTAGPSSYGKLAVIGNIASSTDGGTVLTMRANAGATTLAAYNATGSFLSFNTNASGSGEVERMRITSAGNLLVGTTSAAIYDTDAGADVSTFYRMQVTGGDGNTNYGVAISNGSGDAGYGIWVVNSAAKRIRIAAFQSSATVATAGSEASFAAFSTMTAGALTEKMRIDSSGNVGIGTNSPGQRLDVQTPAGTNVAINATKAGTDAVNIGVDTGPFINGGAFLSLRVGSTERARIDGGGRLYVNTTDNGFTTGIKLSVTGATGEGAFLFKNDAGNNQWNGWVWNTATTGDNLFINFLTEAGGTSRGSITYNRAGGLLAYNTTSDYRAKDIIGPVTDAGATIDALKVYNGKMKGATIARPMLVAHEAQEVVPYAVTGEKDAVNADGSDKHQQMDHQSFIPLLIAEIQSLRARVAQLEGN